MVENKYSHTLFVASSYFLREWMKILIKLSVPGKKIPDNYRFAPVATIARY